MKLKNVLSLFDGISCGQVALNRAGVEYEKYYASEIETNAIKITQANFPKTIQLGDVTKIDFTEFTGKIDLLIGGPPCQDLSIAKKDRKGLSGSRSGLFFKYVEALETIKPKYFLMENVASMSKEDRDTITSILGVEPIMINSALVSAQRRKRLYWTNIGQIGQPEDLGIFLKDIVESGEVYNKKALCLTTHTGGFNFSSGFKKSRASFIAEPILYQLHHRGKNGSIHTEKSTAVTTSSWEYNNVILEPVKANSIKGGTIINVKNKSVTAKNGVTYPIELLDGDYLVRKLTPVECERLQTLPDNYTNHVSKTQRYKTIGNGWTVDVIAHIFSFLKSEVKNERQI